MKITVLDGFTLNPGDNPWTAVAELGELRVFDRTHPDQIVSRSADSPIILTNKTPLTVQTMAHLPDLKLISVMATGHNIVDVQGAAARGITVCNVPVYGTETVAQYVMAALLHVLYRVDLHDQAIRSGSWERCQDFSFTLMPLTELTNKTMGIVGLGRIGSAVARLAISFGMKVLAFSPRPRSADGMPIELVNDLDTLFSQSDVVSIHAPQTESNREFVNRRLLRQMKSSSILINASRGTLVHEGDLADALNDGAIRAACLDVVSREPIQSTNPLLSARNCHLTPHLAWATTEARRRLMAGTADNIRAFLAGHSINVVN